MPSELAGGQDSQLRSRIKSIDAMRGLVMLIMLVDHVRERFFLHRQVSDPMDINATEPALFWSRMAAHLCAPTFVFLTGLSAWLYANPAAGQRSAAGFLAKRGLFILALEVTLVTFSWLGSYHTVYLQVMWAIGISMLALALLCRLPAHWLLVIGLVIVFGHNALTPVQFDHSEWGYSLWTMLHDRGYLLQSEWLNIKVSYPVLPWIGVILLGYCAGPLYAQSMSATRRQRWLLALAIGSLVLLLLLRGFNLYGETLDWQLQASAWLTLMDFLNFTKYPPSLNFLLLALGCMGLILWGLERVQGRLASRVERLLVSFGSAPLFFYLLHLYCLLLMYSIGVAVWGRNHGDYLGVDHIGWVWLLSAVLALALYGPTRWFGQFKQATRLKWVKYL
ncbi:DUF1624 domain-containing protein [Oceanobacter mangrovi]|uniref:DUF1624 domain-containing protein n=1 Tax=Oceanobacter mangrovi TaxID=2862510 RepID=UPI001C8D7089|nr:heparan-alpha-glucosaminide N-acetyltransferase domain-containing protein [Oceanobacter mangrovi]